MPWYFWVLQNKNFWWDLSDLSPDLSTYERHHWSLQYPLLVSTWQLTSGDLYCFSSPVSVLLHCYFYLSGCGVGIIKTHEGNWTAILCLNCNAEYQYLMKKLAPSLGMNPVLFCFLNVAFFIFHLLLLPLCCFEPKLVTVMWFFVHFDLSLIIQCYNIASNFQKNIQYLCKSKILRRKSKELWKLESTKQDSRGFQLG